MGNISYELMDTYVRSKYKQYTVNYIRQCTDVKELSQLTIWFSPNSQPRNHVEWTFVFGILREVKRRLKKLKIDWMIDDCF